LHFDDKKRIALIIPVVFEYISMGGLLILLQCVRAITRFMKLSLWRMKGE